MMNRARPEFSDQFSYLLSLVASVLNNEKPPKPNADIDWASVFYIAYCHSVSSLLYYAVMKLDKQHRPTEATMELLLRIQREQIIKEANITHETGVILAQLDKLGVKCVPLKGILLKDDYPQPDMRTMSDVDILYSADDTHIVDSVFLSRGYSRAFENDNQLTYVKEPFYHYEMHTQLLSDEKIDHDYFLGIWDKISYPEGSNIGTMTESDKYIYLLEHLAKHIENGGAGMRLVMDVYVFIRSHGSQLDEVYVEDELYTLYLHDFEQAMLNLSRDWFSPEGTRDATTELADFILCSCTFGRSDVAKLSSAIREQKKTGHYGYGHRLFKKLFPTYKHICNRFPSARRHKLFYPLYIPAFWFSRFILDKNVNSSGISSYFQRTDPDSAARLLSIIDDFGLTDRL